VASVSYRIVQVYSQNLSQCTGDLLRVAPKNCVSVLEKFPGRQRKNCVHVQAKCRRWQPKNRVGVLETNPGWLKKTVSVFSRSLQGGSQKIPSVCIRSVEGVFQKRGSVSSRSKLGARKNGVMVQAKFRRWHKKLLQIRRELSRMADKLA
jgi:hypothetical protein